MTKWSFCNQPKLVNSDVWVVGTAFKCSWQFNVSYSSIWAASLCMCYYISHAYMRPMAAAFCDYSFEDDSISGRSDVFSMQSRTWKCYLAIGCICLVRFYVTSKNCRIAATISRKAFTRLLLSHFTGSPKEPIPLVLLIRGEENASNASSHICHVRLHIKSL